MESILACKWCPTCKEYKLVSEFPKNRSRKDGLAVNCKACGKKYQSERRKSFPEKVKEIYRRWEQSHLEQKRNGFRKWYSENRNKSREATQRWKANNPGKDREYTQKRRARKKNNGGRITAKEWQEVCEKYGNRCLYPGCTRTDITMDHVNPLKLGGTHTVDNVQPLCKYHNFSKSSKYVDYRPF